MKKLFCITLLMILSAGVVISNDNNSMECNSIKFTIEGGKTFTATLEENSSAEALKEQLAKGNITVEMNDYGIILYQGHNLVIYYDANSWNFTHIGKVNGVSMREEMLDLLGGVGKISITLSLE